MRIPVLRPSLPTADELLPYLREIDSSKIYTNFGPIHERFRESLARYQSKIDGTRAEWVLTSSGTAALELAIESLGLPPNSRIAVPALTFAATATAVMRAGHQCVIADIDEKSWQLTPSSLSSVMANEAIDAVVPVSTYGVPQDINAWSRFHAERKIPVIIDAAGAFGAQKTASGITVVFSFHATKAMTCGEGGAIVTHDIDLADRLRKSTNFGYGLSYSTRGTNAKLTEYHAAIGVCQLEKFPDQAAIRRNLVSDYLTVLAPLEGDLLNFQYGIEDAIPGVFVIRFTRSEDREKYEMIAESYGIETRKWYLPLVHKLPFVGISSLNWNLKITESMAPCLIGLPFFIDLNDRDLRLIRRSFIDMLSR